MCACVRVLVPPEVEAGPNLHLILVSPVLETPAVARRHPQQFTERPCREDPSPVRALLTSSLQRRWGAGWRLSWGLSSQGSVLAIRWGQDPPEEERPGKDPEGQVPAHLLLPIPGWGRGLRGTKSRDCLTMCPRPPCVIALW